MRIWVLIGMIMGVSVVAKAEPGHIDGNGTGGLANRTNGAVDIYDIWEGKNQKFLLGKEVDFVFPLGNPYSETIRQTALRRIRQVAPKLAYEIDRCYWHFKRRLDRLPSGMSFSPPQDIDPTFLPQGWELVRIASYNNETNRILIDENLTNSLPEWKEVALLFHEVIYREQRIRDGYTATSLPARLVTACAFADNCSAQEMKARTANFERYYEDGYYSMCRTQ